MAAASSRTSCVWTALACSSCCKVVVKIDKNIKVPVLFRIIIGSAMKLTKLRPCWILPPLNNMIKSIWTLSINAPIKAAWVGEGNFPFFVIFLPSQPDNIPTKIEEGM